MIILLYGPDDYRREQKKRDIIAEFQKKHSDLGVGNFDAQEKGAFDELAFFLRNGSIFESKKLAIMGGLVPPRASSNADADDADEEESDAGDAKNIAALIKEYAEAPDVTILISEKKKPGKGFAFLAKKSDLAQEFENLAGSSLQAFIQAEAKRSDLNLAVPAAKFLGEVHGANTWALATEITKLSAWKSSVSLADLDRFDFEIAPNYWALVNGMKGYDARARISALEKLLSLNDPPPKIFNILAASWRERTSQFAAYDRAIKSGKLDYEEALVDLVL